MHPAYSVIVFTVASGAGFGLLGWLAFAILVEPAISTRPFHLVAFFLAFALAVAGLLASTLHLGRPERAWRAFSQWRTSWLSREGIAAVAALVTGGCLALAALLDLPLDVQRLLALPVLALAVATVWCTGMIYEQLTTIRAWSNRLVTEIYLVLAAASGLALYVALLALFGVRSPGHMLAAFAILTLAGVLKFFYWREIDEAPRPLTAGDATGLGRFGTVRQLDPPHTGANYIMREMGYSVARKHALKLRRLTLILAFLLPVILLAIAAQASSAIAAALSLLAALAVLAGLVVERWLFFAEARHVVMLYYGADRM